MGANHHSQSNPFCILHILWGVALPKSWQIQKSSHNFYCPSNIHTLNKKTLRFMPSNFCHLFEGQQLVCITLLSCLTIVAVATNFVDTRQGGTLHTLHGPRGWGVGYIATPVIPPTSTPLPILSNQYGKEFRKRNKQSMERVPLQKNYLPPSLH